MTYLASERRNLGHSGVSVTALGLGCAALGGLYSHVADDEARAVVSTALSAGIGYLDTAPQYGHGVSERRLGVALAGIDRGSYVLSTKAGRLVHPREGGSKGIFADAEPADLEFDFSADGISRSLEESLARLGLDRVDIVYLHDPDDHEEEALTSAYARVHELREQGVVGAIGVGMNQSRIPTRFVRETDIDAVLLAGRWTLLDQSGAADLLPACVERGVSVVIGGVFNSGVLADPEGQALYNYGVAPRPIVDKALKMRDVCARHRVSLKAAALRFAASHPAVATILLGARSAAEVIDGVEMYGQEVPAELWSELVAEGLLDETHKPS
ncbi:aldo/keto reductase [Fodinicola acaciae]|uniref:aldo/keto reductase n=1 Tax=Fodinicola acaciae TaxID=2681555 RepID=UPI0013D4D0CA|nr:aldo/keto reductase [Fodinicola acaciae]